MNAHTRPSGLQSLHAPESDAVPLFAWIMYAAAVAVAVLLMVLYPEARQLG